MFGGRCGVPVANSAIPTLQRSECVGSCGADNDSPSFSTHTLRFLFKVSPEEKKRRFWQHNAVNIRQRTSEGRLGQKCLGWRAVTRHRPELQNHMTDCACAWLDRGHYGPRHPLTRALKFGPRLPLRVTLRARWVGALLQNWWVRECAPFSSSQGKCAAALFCGFTGVKSSNLSLAVRGETSTGWTKVFSQK